MAGIRGRKVAEPAALLQSLTSGVLRGADGATHRIIRGELYRADHPLARKYPDLFCRAGIASDEVEAARQAMLAARDAA